MSRFIPPFADVGGGIKPSSGAKYYFFGSNTSTPKNTYSDEALTTPNTNPVISDSNGLFGDIWLEGGQYKVRLTDKNDVQKHPDADPVDSSISESFFNTIALAVADIGLSVGSTVITLGYNSIGDGGQGTYTVVEAGTGVADGGLFIDLDSGDQLQLIYTTPLNVRQFGAVDAGTASTPFSTTAFQAALNTGFNVHAPAGTYLFDDEILKNIPTQTLTGDGAGRLSPDKSVDGWQTRFKIPIGTTIPRYTKTRRNARTTGADPVDNPISCLINMEGTGDTVSGIFGELECDYTDFSSTNLGADCDVFIFNGCRGGQTFENLTWLGYFRRAGILLDSTRSTNIGEFSTPGGTEYSDSGTNGADQVRFKRCQGSGGLQQIALRGPILNGADTYFDESTGLVSDSRGGSGNSDLVFDNNCVLEGRDHHSGYRAYDFIGDPDADDLDLISCPILIDAVRGSSSQGRTRRIHFNDVRLRTIEGARLFLGRAYEVYLNWFHTEPLGGFSGSVYTTAGVLITTPSDTATQTYGPLACQTTSGNLDGTDQVRADGVWGTGLVTAWTSALVTNFSGTRESINPQFSVAFDTDVSIGDDLVVGDQITGANLNLTTEDTAFTPNFGLVAAPTFTSQVGKVTKIAGMNFIDILLTYSGLDTGDASAISITGLPDNKDTESGFIADVDVIASNGLTAPYTLYFGDNGTLSQIGLYDQATGVQLTYDGGVIQAAGTIKFSLVYRT